RHIYLLVDEFEDLRTQRIRPQAATEYLATLRRMIQHNYTMFSMVLASTRDAWDELKLLYPAISDRFPNVIDLLRSPNQVKEVIATYIDKAREEKLEDPWFPFTEEAVNKVIDLRGSVLRHVLAELRHLIDVAAEE